MSTPQNSEDKVYVEVVCENCTKQFRSQDSGKKLCYACSFEKYKLRPAKDQVALLEFQLEQIKRRDADFDK